MKTRMMPGADSEEARRRQAVRIARLEHMSLHMVYANWQAGKRHCAKHGWETEEAVRACRAEYYRARRDAKKGMT